MWHLFIGLNLPQPSYVLQEITVQSPERQDPQEMVMPAGSSARSISLTNIGYSHSAVVAIFCFHAG